MCEKSNEKNMYFLDYNYLFFWEVSSNGNFFLYFKSWESEALLTDTIWHIFLRLWVS